MLNERQIRFAKEYCVDGHATNAAIRAGYSADSAHTQGSDLLKKPEIQARMEQRREELAAAADIDPAWVLKQWRDIASADPNELIQNRRICCRHCWGIEHLFQWTEGEYRAALDSALNAIDKNGTPRPEPAPPFAGGLGFDRTREPAAGCPECNGEGIEDTFVADTRRLKGSARRLYAGVQKTKDGVKILMRDQDAALANLSKYLGMIVDKKELAGAGGGPIAFAGTVRAEHLSDDRLAAIIAEGAGSL